jgi:carbon-monoxide dehydrogenase medium subunit
MLTERDGAVILAGGTDILTKMKNGLPVNAFRAEGPRIAQKSARSEKNRVCRGQGMVIAARSRQRACFSEVITKNTTPSRVLPEHGGEPGAPRRNRRRQHCERGALGGLAADPHRARASWKLESAKGERTLPLEEVFAGPGRTVLARGEILTEVVIPDQAMTGSAYFKYACARPGAGGRRRRGAVQMEGTS